MAQRRMGIIAFLFCLCLCLLPFNALAVSTADAKEAISPEKECSLTLVYRLNGTAYVGVPVDLYKIADVSADFQYTPQAEFDSSGLILNGIQTAGEWNVIRSTLEANILANDINETLASVTDYEGKVCFEALEPGLYLAINGNVENCVFDAALIALPGLGTDGRWQYQVTAALKGEELPPVESDEEITYKILKLWKGDEGKNTRPASIKAEIFKNGKSYKTVILSADNNWSYKWTAKKDGASWKVVEKDVPDGYAMTVEKRSATFVLTNTLPSDDVPPGKDVPPAESPATGDSLHTLMFTALMYVSGILFVILGITGKRKRK